jgi:hypothetical protein
MYLYVISVRHTREGRSDDGSTKRLSEPPVLLLQSRRSGPNRTRYAALIDFWILAICVGISLPSTATQAAPQLIPS